MYFYAFQIHFYVFLYVFMQTQLLDPKLHQEQVLRAVDQENRAVVLIISLMLSNTPPKDCTIDYTAKTVLLQLA